MNKEQIEDAESALSFLDWLKDELKAGNQGLDVELNQLSNEDAQALLKKIVVEVNGV